MKEEKRREAVALPLPAELLAWIAMLLLAAALGLGAAKASAQQEHECELQVDGSDNSCTMLMNRPGTVRAAIVTDNETDITPEAAAICGSDPRLGPKSCQSWWQIHGSFEGVSREAEDYLRALADTPEDEREEFLSRDAGPEIIRRQARVVVRAVEDAPSGFVSFGVPVQEVPQPPGWHATPKHQSSCLDDNCLPWLVLPALFATNGGL